MESQVYALHSTDCRTFMGKFLMGLCLQGLGTQSECVSYHVTVWGQQTHPFILCFGVLDYNSEVQISAWRTGSILPSAGRECLRAAGRLEERVGAPPVCLLPVSGFAS